MSKREFGCWTCYLSDNPDAEAGPLTAEEAADHRESHHEVFGSVEMETLKASVREVKP